MSVNAAPARPAPDLLDRVVRRAEVVGVWAVECVCAHRDGHRLGGRTARRRRASSRAGHARRRRLPRRRLQGGADRAPARNGLRAVGLLGVRAPGGPVPDARGAPAARDRRGALARPGPRSGDQRPASRRRRRSSALGTRPTAARSPGTSEASRWLPRSLTTVRPSASGGIPNGSLSPWTISTGTVDEPRAPASRVFSGRPGGCSGNARHSTPAAPVAAAVRHATRAPEERPPVISGRPSNGSCATIAVQAASSCGAGATDFLPATR